MHLPDWKHCGENYSISSWILLLKAEHVKRTCPWPHWLKRLRCEGSAMDFIRDHESIVVSWAAPPHFTLSIACLHFNLKSKMWNSGSLEFLLIKFVDKRSFQQDANLALFATIQLMRSFEITHLFYWWDYQLPIQRVVFAIHCKPLDVKLYNRMIRCIYVVIVQLLSWLWELIRSTPSAIVLLAVIDRKRIAYATSDVDLFDPSLFALFFLLVRPWQWFALLGSLLHANSNSLWPLPHIHYSGVY